MIAVEVIAREAGYFVSPASVADSAAAALDAALEHFKARRRCFGTSRRSVFETGSPSQQAELVFFGVVEDDQLGVGLVRGRGSSERQQPEELTVHVGGP